MTLWPYGYILRYWGLWVENIIQPMTNYENTQLKINYKSSLLLISYHVAGFQLNIYFINSVMPSCFILYSRGSRSEETFNLGCPWLWSPGCPLCTSLLSMFIDDQEGATLGHLIVKHFKTMLIFIVIKPPERTHRCQSLKPLPERSGSLTLGRWPANQSLVILSTGLFLCHTPLHS
jgi:hypothetical protein